MNILVIGRGGREHTIAQKLAESSRVKHLYVAPGNAGIRNVAECVDIDEMNLTELVNFAVKKDIDLTIVGPEAPLNAGIANRLMRAGLRVFAPTKEAAIIEGSKDYAKTLMKKYDIPTAESATFKDVAEAKAYIEEQGAPIVIKADGLAAGKGVVVAMTKEEAFQAVDDMLVSKAFSDAGAKVVIEEFLEGREFSLMAIVHGEAVYPLVTARDHKRAFDNDLGPNTGGMGAYAPVTDVSKSDLTFAVDEIVKKTARSLVKEGRSFTGILYAGLMLTEKGPKVIEFNARFGDPETQVILPLLKNDLVQVLDDVLKDKNPVLKFSQEHCLGVVIASDGYPGSYEKGKALPDIETNENQVVIHAGTKQTDEGIVSDGGRVLLVGTKAPTLDEARSQTYETCKVFEADENFFYRKDIGK